MNWLLLGIHVLCMLLFVLLGVVFAKGKGAWLIAGYNTASPAEKARYDERTLCRFMGRVMFALAGCWAVVASSEVFGRMWLLWLGLVLFLAVAIAAAIYANTGNRFRK